MTLSSMTGYGRARSAARGVNVTVEISSVNRRQFDARVELPRSLAVMEPGIMERLRERIARGAVTCFVKVDYCRTAQGRGFRVDRKLAESCLRSLRKAARELGLKDDFTARHLLALPGVAGLESEWDSAQVRPALDLALGRALDALLRMREREGRILARDLARRLRNLASIRNAIAALAPDAQAAHRNALTARIARAGVDVEAGAERIAREIALFADKSDISEELLRLQSHLKQAGGALASAGPAGKPLEFIVQELFREINTIGSKANHAKITALVIEFKAELERIREQVQNIE